MTVVQKKNLMYKQIMSEQRSLGSNGVIREVEFIWKARFLLQRVSGCYCRKLYNKLDSWQDVMKF